VELGAAVEGGWVVTGAGWTARLDLHAAPAMAAARGRGLVRPAAACGSRDLYRPAAACVDLSVLHLVGTITGDGSVVKTGAVSGSLTVAGTRFITGQLTLFLPEGAQLAAILQAAATGPMTAYLSGSTMVSLEHRP
jgi:hypothetical protein